MSHIAHHIPLPIILPNHSQWLQQIERSPTAAHIQYTNRQTSNNIIYCDNINSKPSTFKTNNERVHHILKHIIPNSNTTTQTGNNTSQ